MYRDKGIEFLDLIKHLRIVYRNKLINRKLKRSIYSAFIRYSYSYKLESEGEISIRLTLNRKDRNNRGRERRTKCLYSRNHL